MDYKPLDINIRSSHSLKNTKDFFFFKNRVYVVVSIVGSSRSCQETPAGKFDGKRLIKWDFPMRFYVENSKLQQNRLMLICQLRCSQVLGFHKKVVGEVYIPVKELLDNYGDHGNSNETEREFYGSYEVMKPSGKVKGHLCFSYKFGKMIRAAIKNNNGNYLGSSSAPSAPYIGSVL